MKLKNFFEEYKNTQICSVYLLIRDDKVVYVGSSDNTVNRVYSHTNSEKEFDSVEFLRCEKHEKLNMEGQLIIEHNPEYNLNVPGCGIYTTLNQCISDSKALMSSYLREIPVVFMRGGKRYLKVDDYERITKVCNDAVESELKKINEEFSKKVFNDEA